MYLRAVFVFTLGAGVMLAGALSAQTLEDIEQAKNEIWEIEKSIYASRAAGDFQPYIDGASDYYIAPRPTGGWLPGKDGLKQVGARLRGNSQEKLAMNLKAFTLHGDTAVIYYLNHRTMRPEGEVVDEWYEVIHVWVREGEGWQLLASMPRQAVGYEPPDSAGTN